MLYDVVDLNVNGWVVVEKSASYNIITTTLLIVYIIIAEKVFCELFRRSNKNIIKIFIELKEMLIFHNCNINSIDKLF